MRRLLCKLGFHTGPRTRALDGEWDVCMTCGKKLEGWL